ERGPDPRVSRLDPVAFHSPGLFRISGERGHSGRPGRQSRATPLVDARVRGPGERAGRNPFSCLTPWEGTIMSLERRRPVRRLCRALAGLLVVTCAFAIGNAAAA